MDIDFFKKVNDDYGHDKGDFILKEFSRLVKAFMIFGKDELFRWGGEEFVVLTERKIEEAKNIANVLKNMIFQHDFEGLHISVSMGITQMQKEKDQKTLFNLADKALYEAKKSGRNKIVVYE
jgi:polar amino acid transport system substrate-binding protein